MPEETAPRCIPLNARIWLQPLCKASSFNGNAKESFRPKRSMHARARTEGRRATCRSLSSSHSTHRNRVQPSMPKESTCQSLHWKKPSSFHLPQSWMVLPAGIIRPQGIRDWAEPELVTVLPYGSMQQLRCRRTNWPPLRVREESSSSTPTIEETCHMGSPRWREFFAAAQPRQRTRKAQKTRKECQILGKNRHAPISPRQIPHQGAWKERTVRDRAMQRKSKSSGE